MKFDQIIKESNNVMISLLVEVRDSIPKIPRNKIYNQGNKIVCWKKNDTWKKKQKTKKYKWIYYKINKKNINK